MKINHNNYLQLAYNQARINLGKTSNNPCVGCIVVKNNSVISSGITSLQGRPHAEFNALKKDSNFENSNLYVTMEPCTHHGLTPPCTSLIIKKGIKKVYYSFIDIDKRTSNKAKKILKKSNIQVYKKNIKEINDFYKSYLLVHTKDIPYIDAKIAISNDYFTINKKKKWITNHLSRARAHLLRSEYDLILSTSKSINADNSLLNCRIKGLDNNKPDLFIVDLKLKLKMNLKVFKHSNKRKIYLLTSKKNIKKLQLFKQKKLKIIFIESLTKKKDFIKLFKIIKKCGYNRIFIESGLMFLNTLLKYKFIYNLYVFKSQKKLSNTGYNNISNKIIKKIKLKNLINVNLNDDKLYKVRIK